MLPLVSHIEYALRALLSLEKDETDVLTDARPLHYTLFTTKCNDDSTNATK